MNSQDDKEGSLLDLIIGVCGEVLESVSAGPAAGQISFVLIMGLLMVAIIWSIASLIG
jgi:hypothetical protein